MKIRSITYRGSILLLLMAVWLIGGCNRPAEPTGAEVIEPADDPTADGRGFDPLELPADRVVVPEEHPQTAAITTGAHFVEAGATPVPTSFSSDGPSKPEADSRDGQVFRVQIFTDKVYGKARRAITVAEEIFDHEVFLDYEVPYYKVRVGGFDSRSAAEDYQMRAKAAGYPEAWVVAVNVAVQEPTPLYPADSPVVPDEVAPGDEG
jgi:hypothetical protein